MKWGTNLRLSIRALARSWVRTILSVTGVAVGIASVVVLIGAGVGAERALDKALEPLGRNLLVVSAAWTETNALRGTSRVATTLDLEDWRAIAGEMPGVWIAAPVVEEPRLARAEGRTVSVRVAGTTPEFAVARNFPVIAGRFLEEGDLAARRRVVVVGALVVEELFDGESPMGEILHLGGVPFEIVGVTKKKGVSDGANEDELVFIPLQTALRRLLNVDYLSFIYVQVESEWAIPTTREKISALLRERHALRPGAVDDFNIQDQTAIIRGQQQAGGSLQRFVSGLSGLALGLGGVGLLAVSLLSVRERYAEIGLRMAVGGRPRDVLAQFLTEAVLVSLLGGLAGVVIGALGIVLGASLTRWPMVFAWQAAVYPLTISVAIAVVFGAYPALRAARLDPILALNSR